jgi:hypothetical protein
LKVNDVATADLRTFVTVAKDNVLRIWDISRERAEGDTSLLDFQDKADDKEEEEEKIKMRIV